MKMTYKQYEKMLTKTKQIESLSPHLSLTRTFVDHNVFTLGRS